MKKCYSLLLRYLVVAATALASVPALGQVITNFNVENTASQQHIVRVLSLPANRIGIIYRNDGGDIFLSTYEANGSLVLNTNLSSQINWPHTYRWGEIFQATATADGKIFLAYATNTNSTGIQTYNARYTLLNTNGVSLVTGQLNTVSANLEYVNSIQLDRLSDGKIVAVWQQGNTIAAFRMFHPTGQPVAAATSFIGPGTGTTVSSMYYLQMAAGKKGNFMVMLNDYGGYQRGFVFTNAGLNAMSGGATHFTIDNTPWASYRGIGIAPLSNGNFAALWMKGGMSMTGIYSSTGTTVKPGDYTYVNDVRDIIPFYNAGAEGYILTSYVNNDPYGTIETYRYDNYGNEQGIGSVNEGFIISPTYYFTPGAGGGYAYVYTYYKTYEIDEMMGMAMPTGDLDTRAATVNFSMATLPVHLSQFTASLNSSGGAQLSWTTQSEQNNSYFEVQRSTDGRSFQPIGRVEGMGNSGNSYAFTDPAVLTTTTYYKLRQVDIDGRSKDLGVRIVKPLTAKQSFTLFPNPVKGNTVQVNGPANAFPAQWKLYNAGGNEVKKGMVLSAGQSINLGNIPTGVYHLQVGSEKLRFIKQ